MGGQGRLQGQRQQSEAATQPSWAALPREGGGSSRPVHGSEPRGERGSTRLPLLAGKEAKPDNTDNKKSQKGVTLSEISAVTLSPAPMDRQTGHVGRTDRALCFGFRKSKSKICCSVCYVQQYCTVHFISEMLPARVQH